MIPPKPSSLLASITIILAAVLVGGPRAIAGDGLTHYGPPIPPDSVETGMASYYADKFEGRRTASGETFRQSECTAAHQTLPFGSILRVTNLVNRREVLVRVTDRGPFTKSRVVDLSRSAAEELEMVTAGTVPVEIVILRRGPR